MKNNSLSKLSKILLYYKRNWINHQHLRSFMGIYLEAPQYPEGLGMFLHANKITGRLRNYQWTEPLYRDERNTSGRFLGI